VAIFVSSGFSSNYLFLLISRFLQNVVPISSSSAIPLAASNASKKLVSLYPWKKKLALAPSQ